MTEELKVEIFEYLDELRESGMSMVDITAWRLNYIFDGIEDIDEARRTLDDWKDQL